MTADPANNRKPPAIAGADARTRLIDAALHLFGQQGFSATSIRAIAQAAGVNLALISYHFGGKDGLHRACAKEVICRLDAIAGSVAKASAASPDKAQTYLTDWLEQMVRFMTAAPGAEDAVRFLLREIAAGGPVGEMMQRDFFAPRHRQACQLWALATGRDPEDPDVRLAVFCMVGQAIYFHIARGIVLPRMGWSEYGQDEIAAITRRLTRNLERMLELPDG